MLFTYLTEVKVILKTLRYDTPTKVRALALK